MPIYGLLPSFSGGEVAPALWARTDLDKYHVSLRKARDVLIMPHGGLKNRPGTKYLGSVYDQNHDTKTRLIPFGAGTGGNYILEFSNLRIRFWYDDGLVMNGENIYEVTTPYTFSQLDDLKFVQSADILYIAHPDHELRQLKRLTSSSWEIEIFDFDPSPMLDIYTGDATLTIASISSSTGLKGESVAVTSSIGLFNSSDVDRWLRIDWTKEAEVLDTKYIDPPTTGWTSDIVSVNGKFELSYRFDSEDIDAEVYLQKSTDGGTTWTNYDVLQTEDSVYHVISSDIYASDYGDIIPKLRIQVLTDIPPIHYTFKSVSETKIGYLKITTYNSSTSVTCIVKEDCEVTDGRTLSSFYLGAFYPGGGYPASVGFFEDRFIVASPPGAPEKIWLSKTSDYNNFGISMPLEDDDSISLIAATRRINEVKHVIGLKDLILLCSEGEFKVDAADQSALTPTSKRARQQGYRGASDLEPLPVGETILFVQAQGSRVRSLAYSFESDGYAGNDMSILAQHLFTNHTIVDWCYQQEPLSMVWAVRDDGKLLSLTFLQEHEIYAWALHDVGGIVESVAEIPGATRDEVYFVVKRTVNGEEVKYIEKLANRFEGEEGNIEDAFFLDCGVTYNNGPVTSVSGLEHLEGETVTALADGKVIYGLVVESGSITLPSPASKIHIGLPYTPQVQTLEVDYQTRQGTSMTRKKRIAQVTLRLADSLGLQIGPSFDKLTTVRGLIPSQNEVGDLYTGDVNHLLTGGYSEGGTICLAQPQPLPFELLAIVPAIDS